MYYPIQIPYKLSREFASAVQYAEETDARCRDFLICFWYTEQLIDGALSVDNVIVADGCIDIVADFDARIIGFVGMSKTNFKHFISTPCHYCGARLKPGAFHALTGLSASTAMDNFIPINECGINFDADKFFQLPFEEAKKAFKALIVRLIGEKQSDEFITLFDQLYDDIPDKVANIYAMLNFSPRQCQRLFYKHYGITPQIALSILRFQKCLNILTSGNTKPDGCLSVVNYYDQAHFINDFRRNIGITPLELVRRYE